MHGYVRRRWTCMVAQHYMYIVLRCSMAARHWPNACLLQHNTHARAANPPAPPAHRSALPRDDDHVIISRSRHRVRPPLSAAAASTPPGCTRAARRAPPQPPILPSPQPISSLCCCSACRAYCPLSLCSRVAHPPVRCTGRPHRGCGAIHAALHTASP
jgi:hypothetical protein